MTCFLWLEWTLNSWVVKPDLLLNLNPCLKQYLSPNQFVYLFGMIWALIGLLWPPKLSLDSCQMSYVCQVSVIDSMQAPPQLFFLFALELPEVPSALCLEYMCVLSLLGHHFFISQNEGTERVYWRDYLQGCGQLKRNHQGLVKLNG